MDIPEELSNEQFTPFLPADQVTQFFFRTHAGSIQTAQHKGSHHYLICNRLVERWNKTLKSMLKRLCQDQPKQWHRLINPVLFAYREFPQESTGFSPFQLLYGCLVRKPETILKELRTTEVNIPEVKTSTSQSYMNIWIH